MLPKWVKSLTTDSSIHGIAINPETKWVIAHSSLLGPNFIMILDQEGNLKAAYTYSNIPKYNLNMRNLLLGFNYTSSYTAIVQTSNFDDPNIYKLFAFSFSSSSNYDPKFKWGFNSLK